MMADSWEPFVAAVLEQWRTGQAGLIRVRDDYGDGDFLPAAYLFRDASEAPRVERTALERCRARGGRVLDVGAGAGCHSLALQEMGVAVTALEPHPQMVELLRQRGVHDARLGTMATLADDSDSSRFDTILLLMNGLGLAGTLEGIAPLLADAGRLLARGGEILADSTDLRRSHGRWRSDGRYAGEMTLQVEYAGVRGDPFPYLYVDPEELADRAGAAGWSVEVVERGGGGSYLAAMAGGREDGMTG